MRSQFLRVSAYIAPSALGGQAGRASIHPHEDIRGSPRRGRRRHFEPGWHIGRNSWSPPKETRSLAQYRHPGAWRPTFLFSFSALPSLALPSPALSPQAQLLLGPQPSFEGLVWVLKPLPSLVCLGNSQRIASQLHSSCGRSKRLFLLPQSHPEATGALMQRIGKCPH